MKNRVLIVLAIVFGVVAMPAGARAQEDEFIGRFGGAWSGTAMIERGDASVQLSCRAIGKPGRNQIAINGFCSLFIASVRITAEVTYDPATRRYAGILGGAPVGPAKMTGRRTGNVIHLTVHWPQPVNGQMEARLSIKNPGNGHLQIVLEEDPERTTQLVLSRA
jgi:hypothetical protein